MQNYSPHKMNFQYPLFGFKVLIPMKTKFGIRPEKRTGSECSVFCSATFFAISRLVRRNRAQRRKEGKARRGREGLNISKAATRERRRPSSSYLSQGGSPIEECTGPFLKPPFLLSFTSCHDMWYKHMQKN